MIGCITAEGQRLQAELSEKARKCRPGMSPEDASAAAATAALDAAQDHDSERGAVTVADVAKRLGVPDMPSVEAHQADARDYRRGRLSEGHAAPSHQYEGPNTADVPSPGTMAGSQFTRPPASGRASTSPANKVRMTGLRVQGPGPIADTARQSAGKPGSVQ